MIDANVSRGESWVRREREQGEDSLLKYKYEVTHLVAYGELLTPRDDTESAQAFVRGLRPDLARHVLKESVGIQDTFQDDIHVAERANNVKAI